MTHRNLVDIVTEDNFSSFDSDEWLLKGDATYASSRVRLTPATDNKAGALVHREGIDERLWEVRFRFNIENGSTAPADETAFAWYAKGVATNNWQPNGGYQVSYDHADDVIRLDSFVDGEQKTLTSSSAEIADDGTTNEHRARIRYARGEVSVSFDGTEYIRHDISNPQQSGETFFLSARTGSENAAHYVDNVLVFQSNDRNINTAQSEWPSPAIDIGEHSNTYALLNALLDIADEADSELFNVKRAHHIDTATGEQLEQFGELVQLDRKSGESDAKYRARLKVQFRVGNIGTTFSQFSEFAAVLLDTDIQNIDFISNLIAQPATAQISAEPEIYDNAALTRAEVQEFLGEAVPAGHEVSALESGTFRLKSDGESDDASKGLTSDSISTGGTLAADIV